MVREIIVGYFEIHKQTTYCEVKLMFIMIIIIPTYARAASVV
jgi:hypothetical protein